MFYLTPFGLHRNKSGFHLVGDNWNDFGFYTLYRLFYINEDLEETEIGHVKIGYKGQKDGYIHLTSSFDNIPDEYFSLGQDVSFYSELRKLGDDLRIECLTGLNDIAYNKEMYDEVIDEEVVRASLLRDLNINAVTKQFRRVAHGGAVLTNYDFNFSIQSGEEVSNFYFEVVPESLPPTNIHTIIGTNGTGKTTTLKGIIDGYLDNSLNEGFSNAIFISFSVFDKNNHYVSNNSGKEYYYVGVKTNDSKTKSQEDLKIEFYESISKILSKKRHYYLHRMLEILMADNNLQNFGLINILEKFFVTPQDNEAVEECSSLFSEIFENLSSGHQIILLSITKIVELIVEKTLILIDEPETHLHPPLLSAFVRAISEIIIAENAVAILATHSPVVLQEVPRSCVSIIRKHGIQMNIQRPRFETFGENVGVLTEEVFGLEIPKTGFHTLLKKIVEETPDYDRVLERFNNELSIEAKSIVRTYINEMTGI
ncbi:AAA family ATPase [Virgibacillus halodenitrificans]|uniref:AAA family ATPase n=1 Tax=Virgibacillus halodenitrificans TaxID=1482 RepID=UPI0013688EC9|nr:AAA family ATPase [Virgibacillus halodenitrificans]MYL47808.1 AAA family ATPase [Virgibacillus halodenitrificans]